MFYIYVLFLIGSGIAMLTLGFIRAAYARRRRVVNFIFGAGFLVYGLYLLLVFQGGTYFMFYYAFVVPILLIVQFFRDRSRAKDAAAMAAARGPQGGFATPQGDPGPGTWANGSLPQYGQRPAGYGQPPQYGQPQQGQPQYGQPQYGQPQMGSYGQPGRPGN